MSKFAKVSLMEPRSVVQVFDEKPEYTDTETHKIVAYDFDDSTEERLSLAVAADGTITNKHTGKTKTEAKSLNDADAEDWVLNLEKAKLKKRIGTRTAEKLEAIEWKTQRAKEQDYLAGNTPKSDALAAEKKAIRDDGNNHEAGVDALTNISDAQAYSNRPPNWGEPTEWKGVAWE